MTSRSEIALADEAEQDWCARLMASSEPWLTLGRGLDVCRALCGQPDSEIYVTKEPEGPLGFIILRRRGLAGAPYVAALAVAPAHRGGGLGEKLLRFAEDLFRPDHRFIFLCVSSFNPRARQLYERCGYRVMCELDGHVTDAASELLMRKRLRVA